MQVKTISADDIKIKITAKNKISPKIISGVEKLIAKDDFTGEEELYNWEDVKKN